MSQKRDTLTVRKLYRFAEFAETMDYVASDLRKELKGELKMRFNQVDAAIQHFRRFVTSKVPKQGLEEFDNKAALMFDVLDELEKCPRKDLMLELMKEFNRAMCK